MVQVGESVTTPQPFTDRTKALFRDFIAGKRVAMDRTQNYEVKVLPSATDRASQKPPLSTARAIRSATVAALLVSGKADRLWLVDQERACDAEHTRSNLG